MKTVDVVGVRHPADHALCPECPPGYPVACVCGGWIHADEKRPVIVCGGCGPEAAPAEPFFVSGDAHAPGRPDCPACPPAHPAPCVCRGLIHQSPDGNRRCDRCGFRCEDLDV